MDIALVSDTHIPSRETAIPDPFEDRIRAADHVIHAGDFDSESALATIDSLASEWTAAAGNVDPDLGLPTVATVELGGIHFVVTHGTGSRRHYEDRIASVAADEAPVTDGEPAVDPIVAVSGHTHEVLDTVRDGIRLLNPGSATGASPADRPTMLTATVTDGTLSLTTHER